MHGMNINAVKVTLTPFKVSFSFFFPPGYFQWHQGDYNRAESCHNIPVSSFCRKRYNRFGRRKWLCRYYGNHRGLCPIQRHKCSSDICQVHWNVFSMGSTTCQWCHWCRRWYCWDVWGQCNLNHLCVSYVLLYGFLSHGMLNVSFIM